MNLFELGQSGLLAEGGWGQLIGVIVVVGFYIFSAIVKSIGNRGDSDEEKEKARQAAQRLRRQIAQGKNAAQIEEANRRRIERKLPYARSAPNRENMSEWDRQQEEKRRQLSQSRQTQMQPKPPAPEPARMRMEPPPVPAIPVAQPIEEDTEELKRQAYYAKAQQLQQARRRSQLQAQQAAAEKTARTVKQRKKSRPKQQVETKSSSYLIYDLVKDSNRMRSAILLKEILDKPIAMRQVY